MKTKFLALLLALSLVGMASAQNVKPKRGGVCGGTMRAGQDSVLGCEHIGNVTVNQIYEKGFRIVAIQKNEGTAYFFYYFIEEQ